MRDFLYAVRSIERGFVYAIFSSETLANKWQKATFDPDDRTTISTYRLNDPINIATIQRWEDAR